MMTQIQRCDAGSVFRYWTFSISLLAILVFGCRGQPDMSERLWDGKLTKKPGTYRFEPSMNLLTVSVENGLVSYSMQDSEGVEVLRSSRDANDYSRWFFFWDDSAEELWFHSSDVGTALYKKNPTGQYDALSIADDLEGIVNRMPNDFYTGLPQSLKKKWEQYRVQ